MTQPVDDWTTFANTVTFPFTMPNGTVRNLTLPQAAQLLSDRLGTLSDSTDSRFQNAREYVDSHVGEGGDVPRRFGDFRQLLVQLQNELRRRRR